LLYNVNVYTHVRNWVTTENVNTWAKTQETDLSYNNNNNNLTCKAPVCAKKDFSGAGGQN